MCRMRAVSTVTLVRATRADSELLTNLLELYIHDLSEAFEVEISEDGRFGYPALPLYWSDPENRFAFVVKAADRTVGFILVTVGSPMSPAPHVYDIAEFFILRAYRRGGVGKRAAILLWNRFRGRWIVRAAEDNPAAVSFWRKTIADYSGGKAAETQRHDGRRAWRVFSFESS